MLLKIVKPVASARHAEAHGIILDGLRNFNVKGTSIKVRLILGLQPQPALHLITTYPNKFVDYRITRVHYISKGVSVLQENHKQNKEEHMQEEMTSGLVSSS